MTTRAINRKQMAFQEARKALESIGGDAESIQNLATKCGVDYAVDSWRPFGGAMSFQELAANERGREIRNEYDELNWQLRALMNNILDASDLTDEDRATRITQLAEDFAQLADAIPAQVDAEAADDVLSSIRAYAPGDTANPDDPNAKKKKPSFLDRFKKKPATKDEPLMLASSFKAFKEGNDWRWFAVYSNTLPDKTKERFGEKSHRDFIAWADAEPANRMPSLWDWHTPVGISVFGSEKLGMGKADMLDYADGMALAAGYFYPEFEDAAKALSETPDLGTSHGYQYADKALQDGEYSQYFTFEISPLPRARAANEATLFLPDMAKELTMQFSTAKREHLVKIHGEEKTKQIEAALTVAAESAGSKEAGLGFKDFEEALAQAPAAQPAADNSPVPAPAAAGATSAEDALAAIGTIVAAQVKAIVDPLMVEVNALKEKSADFDRAVAAQYGPRITVDPSKSPTAEGNNPINANSKEVREAKAGAEAPQLPAHLAHLQWYAENGGMFETMAAAQAAGRPV